MRDIAKVNQEHKQRLDDIAKIMSGRLTFTSLELDRIYLLATGRASNDFLLSNDAAEQAEIARLKSEVERLKEQVSMLLKANHDYRDENAKLVVSREEYRLSRERHRTAHLVAEEKLRVRKEMDLATIYSAPPATIYDLFRRTMKPGTFIPVSGNTMNMTEAELRVAQYMVGSSEAAAQADIIAVVKMASPSVPNDYKYWVEVVKHRFGTLQRAAFPTLEGAFEYIKSLKRTA
jgi:hypothetical protein